VIEAQNLVDVLLDMFQTNLYIRPLQIRPLLAIVVIFFVKITLKYLNEFLKYLKM